MKYDFDRIIARNGTNAIKWDSLDKTFGATDILPMWVADMDFEAPRPVIDAIVKRAQHGIYGYTSKPESFYYSISSWMEKRHGWHSRASMWIFLWSIPPRAASTPSIAISAICMIGYTIWETVGLSICRPTSSMLRLARFRVIAWESS